MAEPNQDLTEAKVFATRALELMAQHNIPATPINYEIWFTYATGRRPEVTRVIDSILKSGRAFSQATSEEIHDRFFAKATVSTEVMQIGDKMHVELAKLVSSIDKAGRENRAYSETLETVSDELGDATNETDLKANIDRLIAATQDMAERTQELEAKLDASKSEVNQLKDTLDNIREQSLTDQLTGLANRRCFDERLQQALAEAADTGEPLSLLMGDIDHFKSFNDTWGHQTGDQVLRLVGNCLKENVKGRDTAARYGGEEFAVILPNTRLVDALIVGEQIRQTVESKRVVKKSTGESLGVITLSLGAAQLAGSDGPETLINRADACLYAAKRAGRNKVLGEEHLPVADQAGGNLRKTG